MLLIQDTPGQSRLHHFRRLLRNVKGFSTNHSLPRLRSTIFIQALRLLSAYSQTNYLYHVPNGKFSAISTVWKSFKTLSFLF